MSQDNVLAIQPKIQSGMLIFVLIAWVFIGLGCDQPDEVKKISLEKSEKIQPQDVPSSKKETLKIAVSAMISPQKTFIFYKELLDYLSGKMGLPVKLVQRETYEEVNKLLKENELHVAFVCTGAYVAGHDDFGMELLVAPVAYGKPVYYSYIIVPRDSSARTLSDLRGKRFAFTDPLSNTGRLAPAYMLAMMGEDVNLFFPNVIYTYSHDKSIEAVAQKIVDGAAVDSLIWDYLHHTDPQQTAKTKIINKSAPYGIPPVVVPPALDKQLKEELRAIFLHMHEDDQGRKILDRIKIDRFVEVSDDIYDSTRSMQKWLNDEQ